MTSKNQTLLRWVKENYEEMLHLSKILVGVEQDILLWEKEPGNLEAMEFLGYKNLAEKVGELREYAKDLRWRIAWWGKDAERLQEWREKIKRT